MTNEDLLEIEGLLSRFATEIRSDLRVEIREQGQRFDAKLEEQGQRFNAKLEQGLAEQSRDFERWFGIQREAFQHDLGVVAEGHQMLAEKIDRLADAMRTRSEAIERSLSSHKADPNAHQRWGVAEDEGV